MRRRDFISLAGLGAASLALGGRARAGVSPSEKVNIALIGCGWQGAFHIDQLLPRADANLIALCDCYQTRLDEAMRKVDPARCKAHADFRRVLDDKDVDAVIIAAPDHWHGAMAILACQAGKDVYIEKPMTTTVAEGRAVVDAARRHGRVVQVGIQQRTMPVFQHAIRLARDGSLGRIVHGRGWVSPATPMQVETPQAPPPGLDWDMWLGPAPWVPYSPQRHLAFRAFRDYGGGELTNWGVHLLDVALWAMGEDAPLTVQALGTPGDTLSGVDPYGLQVLYEMPSGAITWTQSSPGYELGGQGFGTLIEGTRGKALVTRASCVVTPESLGIEEFRSSGYYFIALSQHHHDWLRCIRTRERPAADCEIGHRSTTLCNLGNIAMEMRRKLAWDAVAERFIGDEAANRRLHRPSRAPWHLG